MKCKYCYMHQRTLKVSNLIDAQNNIGLSFVNDLQREYFLRKITKTFYCISHWNQPSVTWKGWYTCLPVVFLYCTISDWKSCFELQTRLKSKWYNIKESMMLVPYTACFYYQCLPRPCLSWMCKVLLHLSIKHIYTHNIC